MLRLRFHHRNRGPKRPRRGFTLIEASITTVIIGVGCLGMLELLGAGTNANNESTELTTAMNLAGNVREAMTGVRYAEKTDPTHWGPETGEGDVLAYDDMDDFYNWTSSPGNPIDARRRRLGDEYSTWVQQVSINTIRSTNFAISLGHPNVTPDLRPTQRITVTVLHNGKNVYSQSWIASYADPSAPTTAPSSP
jgi:prepilin-type N-terminal cleavage/methylation domain-containing protein